MSRKFCRDAPDPWGCSNSLCKKKFVRIAGEIPTATSDSQSDLGIRMSDKGVEFDPVLPALVLLEKDKENPQKKTRPFLSLPNP